MTERISRPRGSRAGKPRQHAGDDLRARILHSIEEYRRAHGRPPTIREICVAVGIKATSHVTHHVDMLVRQGYLRREPGSRGLMLARPAGLRVLGTIAAGVPLELFDESEPELLELDEFESAMTAIPAGRQSAMREVNALQVRGASMIEDGILDGDYVLIAPGTTVANGAIAVVIDNTSNGVRGAATLKRVFVSDDGVRLQPANAEFASRCISKEEWDREWSVQSTVVAVYRRCVAR
jgi:repressor LexA